MKYRIRNIFSLNLPFKGVCQPICTTILTIEKSFTWDLVICYLTP